MTADINTLTSTQVDILTMAFRRGSYTAFRADTAAICEALISEGLLRYEQDFQYSITRAGAQVIGQQVTMPTLMTEVTAPSLKGSTEGPPTVLVLTDDLLAAYKDAVRLKERSRVLYAVALEKVVRLLGEAIEGV